METFSIFIFVSSQFLNYQKYFSGYLFSPNSHIGLRGRYLELDQSDAGLLHPGRAPVSHGLLLDQCPVDQLRLLHRLAQLLHQFDQLQVDVGVLRRGHQLLDRLHRHRGQQVRVLGDHLKMFRIL